MMGSKPRAGGPDERAWSLRDFILPLLAILLAVGAMGMVMHSSAIHPHSPWKLASKVLWKNASVRPPVLLTITILGWAGVVRVCRGAGMNLDLVLGGPTAAPAVTMHAAFVLLAVVLSAHAAHIYASEAAGLTWRPWLTCNLLLHAAAISLAFWPRGLSRASRASLVATLVESVVAPFAPVTFWHVIVADYLTSMAKAFADLQLTVCLSGRILALGADAAEGATAGDYVRTTQLWDDHHDTCAASSMNAVMLALPFWWRLMQCLRVYYDTREQKNLWNALKYSTAFPLVYAGYLRRHEPSAAHDHLFVVAAVVQSSYCFVWDVVMDWGLPRFAEGLGSRAGSKCKPGMRDVLLVTKQKWVYAALCLANLCLRFAWTLSVFGGLPGRGGGMFFIELVEVARRTAWAVFRIE